MIHPTAIIDEEVVIGEGTMIWAYAHILSGAVLGKNCSVGGAAEIGKNCRIGDDTRISYGVFIPNKTIIGNRVFIGPAAVFTDDRYPVAGNKDYLADPPILNDDCSIGAGAVLLPGITIGFGAMVGAGCVVTENIPDHAVVVGNPSRIIRIAKGARGEKEKTT